jgi:hypothetical protein
VAVFNNLNNQDILKHFKQDPIVTNAYPECPVLTRHAFAVIASNPALTSRALQRRSNAGRSLSVSPLLFAGLIAVA